VVGGAAWRLHRPQDGPARQGAREDPGRDGRSAWARASR
jgi:hypothetical protein